MDISSIVTISYFVIGFILAFYWFNHDYAESYNEAVESDMEEAGMTSIFLLVLTFFWPIKLIKNLIKKRRI